MISLTLSQIVGILLPVFLVLVVLYRLTLHPLAKYPGPLLWKISGWPDAWAAKSGKRHIIHYQLHCKYGHVVRIGPNKLSYNTAEAFHDIHTSRNANVIKTGFVGYLRSIISSTNLQQVVDKREHQQRRKIMSYAFTDSALKSAETFMIDQIRIWTEALGRGADASTDGWSETKDLGHWTNLLTLDIFGELCFGTDFEATKKGDNYIIHLILAGCKVSHVMANLPISFLLIPIFKYEPILKVLSRKGYEARWALRNHLITLVGKRQKDENEAKEKGIDLRQDFFHHILKARDDDGNAFELERYVSEAILLISAGTDTTSTALSAVLFYLCQNPAKMDILRAEVDKVFPHTSSTVEDISTGPKLSSLVYLRACIDEAMRMTPPVPGSLSRAAMQGGTTVAQTHFAVGTEFEVPMYALSHNEEYYPDPFTFTPERWIVGSKLPRYEVTDDLVSKQRHAFVPFSSGPRNCIGMRMAYMEMCIVLARLVYLYDMRFDHTKQKMTKEFETEDWFVSTKDGPHLQFKARQFEKTSLL